MIGNGFIQNFSLSLEKDREVVVDGTIPKSGPQEPFTVVWVNTKLYNIQRKPDFKLNVSIDVKPSAGFKRKANPTGAKCNRVKFVKEESGKLTAVAGIWIWRCYNMLLFCLV